MLPSKPVAALVVVLALLSLTLGADENEPVEKGDQQERSQTVESSPVTVGEQSRAYRTESVRGKVVWLAAALEEFYGISTVPEAAERALALVTPDQEILPLVENLRGRAFRKDERLRGKDMEILVRRYEHQPMAQVLRIYEFDNGERYEVDYWCDVCAIVMFETGPCSCCQDHNRLRKRPVEESGDRGQESGDSGQESGDRGQESGDRGQESGDRGQGE